jgi:hypothetical protein
MFGGVRKRHVRLELACMQVKQICFQENGIFYTYYT